MKKIVMGLIVLGFTSLCYSQNIDRESETLEVVNVYNKNIAYIDIVQEENMSVFVKLLEDKAAKYDVTKSSKFDGRIKPFKIVFKSIKGSIIATYDSDGKILSTKEKFKNIKLPIHVVNCVYKEYSNWSLLSDVYHVSYHHDKDVKKIFKIVIGKGELRKSIKINSEGEML